MMGRARVGGASVVRGRIGRWSVGAARRGLWPPLEMVKLVGWKWELMQQVQLLELGNFDSLKVAGALAGIMSANEGRFRRAESVSQQDFRRPTSVRATSSIRTRRLEVMIDRRLRCCTN